MVDKRCDTGGATLPGAQKMGSSSHWSPCMENRTLMTVVLAIVIVPLSLLVQLSTAIPVNHVCMHILHGKPLLSYDKRTGLSSRLFLPGHFSEPQSTINFSTFSQQPLNSQLHLMDDQHSIYLFIYPMKCTKS